jgi:hypothetical protein
MHGASLHRRHRFRGVMNFFGLTAPSGLRKAASRPGLPHALIRCAHPSGSLQLSTSASLRFQDASRSRGHWSFRKRASVLDCGDRDARRKPASAAPLSRGDEFSFDLEPRPACKKRRRAQACRTHSKTLRVRAGTGAFENATASWTAVTEMHGASLHRRHRFRGVMNFLWTYCAVRPAKSGVAPRLVARSPRRFAFARALELSKTRQRLGLR